MPRLLDKNHRNGEPESSDMAAIFSLQESIVKSQRFTWLDFGIGRLLAWFIVLCSTFLLAYLGWQRIQTYGVHLGILTALGFSLAPLWKLFSGLWEQKLSLTRPLTASIVLAGTLVVLTVSGQILPTPAVNIMIGILVFGSLRIFQTLGNPLR